MTDDIRGAQPAAAGGTAAPLDADALAAIARTRAQGLHFWGRILGIDTITAPDGTPLLRAAAGADLTAVATLTDVSLGQVIRAGIEGPIRLATTSLTIQHVTAPSGAVSCGSRVIWMDPAGHRALAQAYAEDDAGALVATARAWFSVLPLPAGTPYTPMPWERDADQGALPTLTAADLTADELAAAQAATAAQQRRTESGLGLAEELLDVDWRTDGDRVVAAAAFGPHLGNRVGMLQGGALYGITALAAQRAAGPGMVLAEGSLQYLRPGHEGEIIATASLTRRGRTVAFVDVSVEIAGREIATGHHTFFAG